MVCGTIIDIAVAGDFGVCHADCHEEDCGKAKFYVGSRGLTPVSFRRKRRAKGWRREFAKRIDCSWAAREEVCRSRYLLTTLVGFGA